MTSTTIYTSEHRTPFTYYIKWSKYNISYYGCRYSKNCNPTDLWNTYFTSSKYVKEFIKTHGDPDIIKITKVFTTIESCREWEGKFLSKTKASKNNKMLNRSNPGSYGKSLFKPTKLPGNTGAKGIINDFIKQMCLQLNILNIDYPTTLKGRYWVNYKHIISIYFLSKDERNEFLYHNKEWSSGRVTSEQREKISATTKGIPKPPRSKEHSLNISKATKGKKSLGSGPKDMITYHNNISEIRIPKDSLPPEGFLKGRIPNKYGNKNFGKDMLNYHTKDIS